MAGKNRFLASTQSPGRSRHAVLIKLSSIPAFFSQTAPHVNNNIYFSYIWTSLLVNKNYYYMASSPSGQDKQNRALLLAIRTDKMEPSCPLGTTRCIPRARFPPKPYTKSFIHQVCSVKMAGYWPRSFFATLWTSTLSRSLNTQKKNLANIQPS